jgi:hypothetical protein
MADRLTITATAPNDVVDPDHPLGLTEDGWDDLNVALTDLGYTDIDARRS